MYCFKFPTTVLVIDDCKSFSSLVRDILYNDGIRAKSISQFMVIDFLKRYSKFLVNFESCFLEENINKNSFLIFQKVHKLIYNYDRFRIISVMIIDFNMPNINGIDICKKIPANVDARKIMLTGEMDNHKALEALNAGIIDFFITKFGDIFEKNFVEVVRNNIEVFPYFSKFKCDFIKDPILNKFLENFINVLNPFEYYIFNKNGSAIFIDKSGNVSGLLILSEQELDIMYDCLSIEFKEDSDIISVKNKEKMPVFFSDNFDVYKMRDKIIKCEKINCTDSIYYYVYTNEQRFFDISFNEVKSYESFLKEAKEQKDTFLDL